MYCVLLVLEGPLQAWGTQSRFGHRDTDREPSKSGVLGLIASALGMQRDDDTMISKLSEFEMAVRVDREGTILSDYHTAGGGTFRRQPHSVWGAKNTVLSERFYLMDACFVVGLSHADRELCDRVGKALAQPRWSLFLGRKACVPSRPVLLSGPQEGSARELVSLAPWQGRPGAEKPPRLRMVTEDTTGELRRDVPVSFTLYNRTFATRFVQESWLVSSALPEEK